MRCGVFSPVTVEAKGLYFVLKTSNGAYDCVNLSKNKNVPYRVRHMFLYSYRETLRRRGGEETQARGQTEAAGGAAV